MVGRASGTEVGFGNKQPARKANPNKEDEDKLRGLKKKVPIQEERQADQRGGG